MVAIFDCNHFIFVVMRVNICLFFSFMLVPIISVAQSDTVNQLDDMGRKTGFWIKFHPNTRDTLYKGTFYQDHPVNLFKRYHPNGHLKARMWYDSTGQHVKAVLFDEQGNKAAEGSYVNQGKEGTWLIYTGNNEPKLTIHYRADKLNGPYTRYYSNGEIAETMEWTDNLMNGQYQFFDPSGQIRINGQYQDNLKVGIWTFFTESGQEDFKLQYQAGTITGGDKLDARQQTILEQYERGQSVLRDPEDYRKDPEGYIRR